MRFLALKGSLTRAFFSEKQNRNSSRQEQDFTMKALLHFACQPLTQRAKAGSALGFREPFQLSHAEDLF